MTLLIRYWLDLCLLRAAPQDGPASSFVLGLALTCYAMISVLVLTASYGMLVGARLAILDLLLLVTFILVLLYLSGKITRTYQTLAAMFGAGSLLGLCALPLVLLNNPSTEDTTLPAVASMAWLVLWFWHLVVSAHIIRHALSSNLVVGFVLSLLYMVISTRLALYVIPLQEEVGLAG